MLMTPPSGTQGALSCAIYEGFTEGESDGRRVTSKVFTTAISPSTECAAAAGRTATVYLDELGRDHITDVVLGASYPGVTIKAGDRTYDSLGRVVFEAEPYPASENRDTAYGITRYFNADGTLSCAIRGNGLQPST